MTKRIISQIREILVIVKNRDLWDTELTAKVNYMLLQQRFELIETKLENLVSKENINMITNDKWKGFVEWHNKRTLNGIENPEDCQCVLKEEWRLKND